ncbi:MAG: ATP synthase F0 subunit B [Deltaproteobacteria bacterium]|nr:ATP synthase F0 subunit B [Deltaproteobacteria bacterium]
MKKLLSVAAALFLFLSPLPQLWASDGGYSAAQWRDILYRVLCFAAFFGVLYRFARRPLANFFRERRENIASNLEYLEAQARNLEEQKEIMSKEIANIAAERDAILAHYESLGQKEAERIMAEAKAASEAFIEKTREAMELEIKSARQTLLAEIVNLSSRAAQELVQKNITPADHERLTREFMEQVEKLAH